MKHGFGTWKSVSSFGEEYSGDWFEDKFHGKGTYNWPDGRHYKGEWKDGKMHGYGEMKYDDGCRYEGHYANDKPHGHGIYYWPQNDKRKYDG